MIHYDLRCGAGHIFEAWFRNSEAFEQQAAKGDVACPICQATTVERAPMAPSVAKKGNAGNTDPSPEAMMRHALRALRQAVESQCENVGERFAEEARKIHYGETPPHGIYGDATSKEAEALADEGIAVNQIPWLPNSDS
jgi:hypothetical protein